MLNLALPFFLQAQYVLTHLLGKGITSLLPLPPDRRHRLERFSRVGTVSEDESQTECRIDEREHSTDNNLGAWTEGDERMRVGLGAARIYNFRLRSCSDTNLTAPMIAMAFPLIVAAPDKSSTR